ncbi:MAG: hypothetical protein ABEI77_04735 [Halorientalis sp.]
MERRKFLIGAGSLAAGSAAAMGTGAFTSVQADRSVSVNVAKDSNALLALKKTTDNKNKDYAKTTSSNEIKIDISGSNGNLSEGPSGLNQDAETRIFDIFTIQNQGTQPAVVWVPPGSVSDDQPSTDVTSEPGFYIDPQATDKPNGNYGGDFYTGSTGQEGEISLTGIYKGPKNYVNNTSSTWSDWTLDTGESFDFGLVIKADGSYTGDINMTLRAQAVDSVGDKPNHV